MEEITFEFDKNPRNEILHSISLLFGQLYGEEAYFEMNDYPNFLTYKKQFVKLLNTLKIVIENNVNHADNEYKKRLIEVVEVANKKASNSTEGVILFQIIIECQTKIVFMLIGNQPENFSSKKIVTNNKHNWKLNKFRTIVYLQTEEQKEKYILDLMKKGKIREDFLKVRDFLDDFGSRSKRKETLLDFFKRKYPIDYLNIFG